jgi:TolB-like protein
MAQAIDPTLATQAVESGVRTTSNESEVLPRGAIVANRYRIESLLGAGGMGAVYRAHDIELDEEIALKTLRADISNHAGAIERFRREVKLARKVTHPNVARTFDLCACEGFKFITMELIEGVSLSTRVERGALNLSESLRIAADIARGLVAAHSAGVVHRDLKPDNVMLAGAKSSEALSGAERVVITDFGIARAADDDHEGADERSNSQRGKSLTVGGIIGTPAYMAPEQVVGETPDGRSDVYALGALLFELLTARLPFEGESAVSMAMARLSHPARDVRELVDVPEPVALLLGSMLARDRRERPDATRVLEELEQLRGVSRGNTGNPVAGLNRVPGTTTMLVDATSAPKVRSVAVMALTSADGALAPYGRELGATLADSLARVRSLRVIPPAVAGDELAALSKGGRADVALSGSVRAEGERLRVNLRYIDLAQGTQKWSERFEGTTGAAFALEDALTRAAEAALRALSGGGEAQFSAGPTDPTARALFDKAVELSHRLNDSVALEQGLDLARRAHAIVPMDASVLSLLGLLVVRNALNRGGDNASSIAEAEDWALRALNADAGSAATYVALGLVRLHQGDVRASVRAFKEALSRDARNAEASAYLGRFLVESGYIDEGIKRLEFALKIEPHVQHAWWSLARSYALLGDWPRSDDTLQRALTMTGSELALLVVRCRLAFWKGDRGFARETAERIEQLAPQQHLSRSMLGPLQRFANGEKPLAGIDELRASASVAPSPAFRAFWFQVGAEMFGASGRIDATLDAIEGAVSQPFIDLGWMDHCPALAIVRGAGRFGQARAIVASRATSLWK